MRYKCIKGFSVEKCDDNGFSIENEYEDIEVGSVWETGDAANMMVGGLDHIRLENINDGSWLEIPKEMVDEYFKQIKPLNDKGLKPLKQYSFTTEEM